MTNTQLIDAEKHIKRGWIAGTITTVITLVYAYMGTINEDVRFQYGMSTWSLLDVALLAGLTYGIYKKNRYCALTLLIYFVGSKLLLAISSGKFTGGILSIVFAYFFFLATRAAFQIYKHRIEVGEIEKKEKERNTRHYIRVGLSAFVGLLIVVFFVVAWFSPETEVVPGKQLNKRYVSFLQEEELISSVEEIQYWYSDAFGDFKDGFYLYTNEKVIAYCQDWEEPAILVPFHEIYDIEFVRDESFIEDSRITLHLYDDSTVYFPVSSENDGDQKFYDRLWKLWKEKTKNKGTQSTNSNVLG